MIETSCSIRKPTIAFLASAALRKPGGTAYEFIARHREKLQGYRIITTGGVGRDLFEQGPGLGLTVHTYLPSDQGGLVQISRDIVRKQCEVVVNLADTSKPQSMFSWVSNNDIFNAALNLNVEMLINQNSADLWISGQTGVVDPQTETLALIAHSEANDRKPKDEITALAAKFGPEFARFQRIICTGSTGKFLAAEVPAIRDKIVAYESGMSGGDDEISAEMVEDHCQHVIFLINPKWAQPHQQAVFVFNDIARKKDINIMFTNQSAWRWAGALRQQLG
jgi:methylglyoxal synthase